MQQAQNEALQKQAGNDKAAEGQAQNRRVVGRILQNKGIAGT
jgi:hypothetical protein